MSDREQIRIRVGGARCPYCHDALEPEQAKRGCEACLAWAHAECWEEHGGCSACGDSDAADGPPPAERGPISVVPWLDPAARTSSLGQGERGASQVPLRGHQQRRAQDGREANRRFLGGLALAGSGLCVALLGAVAVLSAVTGGGDEGSRVVMIVLMAAGFTLTLIGLYLRDDEGA